MAIIKSKDLAKMTQEERKEKLEELRTNLIKARAGVKKGGKLSIREIKKTIAKILTIDNLNEDLKNLQAKTNKQKEEKK